MSLQKELMTWESSGLGRWVKKYRKKRHRVGVKQLQKLYPDLVKTLSRAGTRAAANQWWTDKQRDLRMSETSDGMVILRILLEEQEAALHQASIVGDSTLVNVVEQRVRTLRDRIDAGDPIDGISLDHHADEAYGAVVIDKQASPSNIEQSKRDLRDMLWRRSTMLDAVLPVSTPTIVVTSSSRSLKSAVDLFLDQKRRDANRKPVDGMKPLSIGRFTVMKAHLDDFLKTVGHGVSIEQANHAQTLTSYHASLLNRLESGEIGSTYTARDRMTTVKQFFRWCYEEQITDAEPRNIRSRKLQIQLEDSETVVFDLPEFRTILDASPDRTKLFLLLVANCGLRQSDISDLRMRELDGDRLAHARVKTRKTKPPVVNYKLWPETYQLLSAYLDGTDRTDNDHVFLNDNGTSLKSAQFVNGGERYIDNIRSSYWRVLDKLDVPKEKRKPLGAVRATSADLLKKFGKEVQTLFLGNKPTDVTGRHYTATYNDYRLDEPLEWLREQYFGGHDGGETIVVPVVLGPSVPDMAATE